jgi:hypothetical protein
MSNTYLTTEALAERIHYDPRTIRDRLKDSVLIEGKHYFRPFGGRKILYIWEVIERDMMGEPVDVETSDFAVADNTSTSNKHSVTSAGIPMASGGYCNG